MKKLFTVILLTAVLAGTVSLGVAAQPSEALLSYAQYSVPPLPRDAALAADVVIDSDSAGHRRIQRWERVIDDIVHVQNDYVRVHIDLNTNEIILYEKRWRDIDIDLSALETKLFAPPDGEYIWKKVVLFVDEEDCGSLGDFFKGSPLEGLPLYDFLDVVGYPLVCWEVRYTDGTTAMYDLDGNRIGQAMIAAPSAKGYLASGIDPNPIYELAWIIARNNANSWYSTWTDSTTTVYNPDPDTNPISPYVSDPDTLFYYAIGHGSHMSYSGLEKGGDRLRYYTTRPDLYPGVPNPYDDMQNRDPMRFALMVHCDSMTEIGQGSFSHAFRKGSLSGTVTVGFTGLLEASLWANLMVFFWKNQMLAYMTQGWTIWEAYSLATCQYDVVAPYVRFLGDTSLRVTGLGGPSGVKGYVGGSTPVGGIPLQGAKVAVPEAGLEVFTNSAGYYELPLPPGTYTLTASYLGFYDQTYVVLVVQGHMTQQHFMLEPMYPGFPIPEGSANDLAEVGALQPG